MVRTIGEGIPQVIAILAVTSDRRIRLKKAVREYLGIGDRRPLLVDQGEFVLTTQSSMGRELAVDEKGRIRLPEDVVERLGLDDDSMVALVERKGAAAVKGFEVVEEEGEGAELFDLETTYKVTRKAITNPIPEQLLSKLREKCEKLKLIRNVGAFLKGRRTLEAWRARRILGITEPSDEDLRRDLVEQRLERQRPDGSWEGEATITARNLRELADLGLTKENPEIKEGARWLMERPESKYNPGMFFATEDLLREQAEVIKRREKQTKRPRERFNQRKALEVGLVRAADDFIIWPCGPRITWTTALVLEALLKLGFEDEGRVQSALWMLKACRWCDNAQQHGISPDRQAQIREPCPVEKIVEMEKEYVRAYRNAVEGRERMLMNDMTSATFFLRRVTRITNEDGDSYKLWMPDMGGGCPVITARALSHVKDGQLRRLAEAHLWQFISWQRPEDGVFRGGGKFFSNPTVFVMDLLARYDHPVARVGILRAVPWMLRSQNEDGSWGEEPHKDATTLAVVAALQMVSDYLPPDFILSDV